MKAIVLGRITGNLAALRACYDRAREEGFDVLAHTGDLGPGPLSAECVRFLRDRNIPGVRGRWEEGLSEFTGKLHPADRIWLQNLPFELRVALGTRQMAIFHAGPVSLTDRLDAAMPDEAFAEAGGEAGADIVVVGSASGAWHRQAGGRQFVGAPPLDRPGTSQTGYAVIVSESKVQATFREFSIGQAPAPSPRPDPSPAREPAHPV